MHAVDDGEAKRLKLEPPAAKVPCVHPCTSSSFPRLLGFPDAEASCLVRLSSGIRSARAASPSFLAMVNYPATVRVSTDGVAMIDYWWKDKGRYSSVDVYAENCAGQPFGLFTLNCSFMGYLQGLKRSPDAWSAEQDGKRWASVERQYFTHDGRSSFHQGSTCALCSFNINCFEPDTRFNHDRKARFNHNLPLTKFGASFLVGTAGGCDVEFPFEQVVDPAIQGERLVLVIDGDVSAKKLKLQIRQVAFGQAAQSADEGGGAATQSTSPGSGGGDPADSAASSGASDNGDSGPR